MPRRLEFLVAALRPALAWSRPLNAMGVLGVVLGAVCLAAAGLQGAEVAPEGNLVETGTFNGSIGLFGLTLVVLAAGVTWSPRGGRWWAGLLAGASLYAYAVETVQAFRGLDPRFSQVAGPADQLIGGVFFLDALLILGCFIVLAVKYFRAAPSPLILAVRYGALASFVAFGVGIWMSVVTQGRHIPEAGNLLLLHAVGFHGLQAVPMLALLAGWAVIPEPLVRRCVHLAGSLWLGACLALAWQAGTGGPVVELSLATAIAAVCLLSWFLFTALAARDWLVSDASHTPQISRAGHPA